MKWLMLISFLSFSSAFAKQDPEQIIKKSISSHTLKTLNAKKVVLTATLSNGEENIKEYQLWRKQIGKSLRNKSMSRFYKPKKISGQGVLMIETGSKSDGNDIRLYLPAFKRVRRIERAMQSGNFMGTAFSYTDLLTPEVNNYKYKYIKKTKCLTDKKSECHEILVVPKSREIAVRRGYHFIKKWIRVKDYVNDTLIGYNKNKEKIKILSYSDHETIAGSKFLARKIVANDLKRKLKAEYKIEEFEANKPIKNSIFTETFLRNP